MTKVVLGGGLAGLSAAYYALKKLPNLSLILVESSNRLGGWIKSNILDDGVIFEQGPRTIRPYGTPGSNTLSLIEDLGVSDKVVPILTSHPAARNRMICVDGQLLSLPSKVSSLFKTEPPFSKPLLSYLINDLFAHRKTAEDESIYDFVNRRFGQELADYLISPLICGICAGNSKEISVKFLMKQLFEYEQTYGSISRGLARNFFTKKEKVTLDGLPLRAKQERWNVYSLVNGLETLPNSLESYVRDNNVDIRLGNKCARLETRNDGIVVYFENGKELKCDHVISSLPAFKLADIVENQHPTLAKLLRNIKSVTVGVVNLEYKGKVLATEGFGFLVPPKENLPILGVIFDSCCFPKNSNTVLTVMMGGHWFEQLFGKNPEETVLLNTAKEQLTNILGLKSEPIQYKVNILPRCIPQYVVGHEANLNSINQYISEKKLPISLCGASYYGVGVNDVIVSAKNAVVNL